MCGRLIICIGQVFTKGEPLNIVNAYADEKFNKEFDTKTGFKTNTVITVPIKDETVKEDKKRIIGKSNLILRKTLTQTNC